MVSQVLEKYRRGGDFLVGRMPDPNYSYEGIEIDNSAGDAVIHYPAGQPLKSDGTPVLHSDENLTHYLLLEETHVAVGEKLKVTVFARGPAVINFDALPTADTNGTNYVEADLLTAVEALHDVVVRREPTIQAEQTT